MTDTPWLGDACSLVDAFRAGERSPIEELDATLAAVDASHLNAFAFVDEERARQAAAHADVHQPFGGVPFGVKELDQVDGWPDTGASLVFRDRVATRTGTMIRRILGAGAVPVGQTTASEFGGLNVSVTKLHGVTGNGWDRTRTAGGSSGGSAAAVAGGLVTLASGGDGGGSIRIPAGFNGLVGMKGTVGRIPRGPGSTAGFLTAVIGCLARSVRDVCRWYDVASGPDPHDPYSLPRITGWEADLGTHDLRGMRVAIQPAIGRAVVRPEVADLVQDAAETLARDAGLRIVDHVDVAVPDLGYEWAMAGLASLMGELEGRWPECRDELTDQIAFGLQMAADGYTLEMAARCEQRRTLAFEAMAEVFEQVDFVICATNPDVAYPAEIQLSTRVGGVKVKPANNGALTIPANIYGSPAVSVPVGTVDDLPVGMQIMGRHHTDALLLDLARLVEQERPWPLTGPLAPC